MESSLIERELEVEGNGSNVSSMESLNQWLNRARYVEIGYQSLFFLVGGLLNICSLKAAAVHGQIRSRNSLRPAGPQGWLPLLNLHIIIADLIILLVYCSGKTIWQIVYFWYGGNWMCKLFKFFSIFGFYLWAIIAVIIAFDMLYSIYFPLKSRCQGVRRVKIWLCFGWTLAGICSAPQLFLWGTVQVPSDLSRLYREQCTSLLSSAAQAYQCYHVITVFYLPIALIITAYGGIALTLTRQRKAQAQLQGAEAIRMQSKRFSIQSVLSGTGDFPTRKSPRMGVFKTSIGVILTYGLTWLPYQIVALKQILCGSILEPDWEECINALSVWEWLEGFIIAGACINPLIYRFMNQPAQQKPRDSKKTVNGELDETTTSGQQS